MWVIVVCIVLVLVGLVAVVRWGGLAVEPPPVPGPDGAGPTVPPPVSLVVRRYLWYLAVALLSGAAAGILAAGAGGRLVMRLLAVTAGADAQGQITEAEEIVGRITVDGTIGFVVFTGLFFGRSQGPPTCCCAAGCRPGRLVAWPSAPCWWSSPAPALSRCALATPTSTWSARAGSRWPPSRCSWCSTACWLPPWPGGSAGRCHCWRPGLGPSPSMPRCCCCWCFRDHRWPWC